MNVLHSICQEIWKTQQRPQVWNRQVFILNQEKDSAQTTECSNYCETMFLSHASKVILKNYLIRPEQYMNQEFPDVQSGFRRGRGTRNQITIIH